ncbi:gamma subclass chorismate mutase AroQ [Streptomyces niveus]|uniref:gamma subclass chorismate mutase AroQ n=1 Tax=Streptomyces niveus TaxID=193462 RepID=UPI0033F368CB
MRIRRTRSVAVSASVALLFSAAAVVPAVAQSQPAGYVLSAGRELTALTDLFAERLLVADKVAAAKYGTDRPIDDPARERKILDDVADRAVGLGLDPDVVVAVFGDQIEANKVVQRGLYARWDAHPDERPTQRPDLDKDIRPHSTASPHSCSARWRRRRTCGPRGRARCACTGLPPGRRTAMSWTSCI